jgi:hypothetical protein
MWVQGSGPTQLCRSYSLILTTTDPFTTTCILKLVTDHKWVFVSGELTGYEHRRDIVGQKKG